MAIVNALWQFDGTPYAYTSPNAGIVAANIGDEIVLWYGNIHQSTTWYGFININKAITLKGGLSHRRITLKHTTTLIQISASCTIDNLTLNPNGLSIYCATSALIIDVCRCKIEGSNAFSLAAASTLNVYNNLISATSSGIYSSAGTHNIYNNTFYSCRNGLYQDGSSTFAVNNNVFVSCQTECTNTITGSNNASQDGTAPATGRVDLNAIDPKFVRDNLNDEYPDDFRIITGSTLATAGVDMGLSEDIDGISYSGGFPIGCSFGLTYPNSLIDSVTGGLYHEASVGEVQKDVAFGANSALTGTLESTDPGIANVVKDVAYTIESSAKTGTFDETTRNTDPGVANVVLGTAYIIATVAKTGTFNESSRNTDPGIANVIEDVSYKHLNVDKDGTFNESARNTDPGIANVIKDVTYKIESADKVGTFDESVRNTDPGIANVKILTSYKIQNADLEGTYDPAGSPPTEPVITVVDNADGTTATVTITGSDATADNTAYIAEYGSTTWTASGATITGDGTITITASDIGKLWVVVYSVDTGGQSISNVYVVTISDSDTPDNSEFDNDFSNDNFLDAFGATVTYTRGETEISITAMDSLIGSEMQIEYGASLVNESREFIFKRTEIEEIDPPARGDTITDGYSQKWEVSKIGNAAEWEYDADRNYYRVRTILVED